MRLNHYIYYDSRGQMQERKEKIILGNAIRRLLHALSDGGVSHKIHDIAAHSSNV